VGGEGFRRAVEAGESDQRWSEAGQTARRRWLRTRWRTTPSESPGSSGIDCGQPYAMYIAASASAPAARAPLAGGSRVGEMRRGRGDLRMLVGDAGGAHQFF
jgi:hypothetical protein